MDNDETARLIWQRLEAVDRASSAPAAQDQSPAATPTRPRRIGLHGLKWRILDVIGFVVWLYPFVKLFVADVDRIALSTFAPSALGILDYRFVFYLLLLVALILVGRRYPAPVLYVVLFPLVVLFIKVPLFLFRHRSWPFFLALLQIASALAVDFRYNVITKSLAVVAATFILTTDNPLILGISASYLAVLLVVSLYRRLRSIFSSPTFVTVQRRAIRRVMQSTTSSSWLTLAPQYTNPDLPQYSPNDATQVETVMSLGIGLNKVLLLWAYQLDTYRRRYSPAVVFNLLTYGWIFIASFLTLSLITFAVLKADPSQYTVESPRPLIAVLVYTLSTFVLGEAGGMKPAGQVAYLLQLVGGLTGIVILATMGINLLLTYVRERDDTATQGLIDELREEARQQDALFRFRFAVSVDEAYRRLSALRSASTSLIDALVRAIPTPERSDADEDASA